MCIPLERHVTVTVTIERRTNKSSTTAIDSIRDPDTNEVVVSDAGFVEAIRKHSCNIGNSAAFASDTAAATGIHFDEDH